MIFLMTERVKDHNPLYLEPLLNQESQEVVYQKQVFTLLMLKINQKALQIHWAEPQDQEVKHHLSDPTEPNLKLTIRKLMKMMSGLLYRNSTLFYIMRSKNNLY